MIYNDMVFEQSNLFNVSVKESNEMINYLESSYILQESVLDQKLKSIIDRLKDITAEIKDKDVGPKEIKEELDDIYDDIRSIGTIKQEQDHGQMPIIFGLLTAIFGLMSLVFISEAELKGAIISIAISIFMAVCTEVAINRCAYDKVYEILIQTESKAMLEKKKAKEINDTKYEKQMDRLIEFIEEFKTKRRNEYKNRNNNYETESVQFISESDKSEIKVNNFKQSVDEVDRYLNIAFKKVKICSETVLFMVKKALSMNTKNKDKVLNEIIDKGNQSSDDLDKGEIINITLADSLIRKWGNTFSSKYTSYGMEVRENFEKRLASFNSEVIDYINKFNDELSTLVCGAKGKSIKEIANKLHENVRHNASIDAADKANDTIASWFNGNMNYYYFIDQEIHWAQSMMKSTKIKSTLRYKIFSKFAK